MIIMPALKKRKIPRRIQIENIAKKGYFKKPLSQRRFTTRRIMNGNLRTIQSRTILIDLLKLMKAKMKTKIELRRHAKTYAQQIQQSKGTVIKAIQKSGQKSIKKRKKLGIEGGTAKNLTTAINKYMAFRERQGTKLERIAKKEEHKIKSINQKLKITKKSKQISSQKGRLDSVIINLAGIPVRFKVNEKNMALIEQKLRPQTLLEPKSIATRRILIKNPRRKITTILKNLKTQGIEVNELFVAKIIRKMIDEKLIDRHYPELNKHLTKK